ncbi:DUF3997 domain-containing protein [Peribacillus sp. NPDC096379]|uniref:DUF3997 domain-containing protein n=1 Tax=Peribacillus sp. NPDC096379 TaxID=3364393 RepID=UPI0037F88CA9
MKKIVFLSIFLVFTLTACIGPGLGESETEITKDYVLINTGRNKSLLVKRNGEFFDFVVPATVIATATKDQYIFAKQQKYIDDSNSEKDGQIDTSEDFYWIVTVSSEDVKGPLSLDEFNDTLQELGVNSKMKWVKNEALNLK